MDAILSDGRSTPPSWHIDAVGGASTPSPQDYQFTLWTRRRINPNFDTNNTEIADFGPVITAVVPEPATWALLILGFGVIGAAMRRGPRPALLCAFA